MIGTTNAVGSGGGSIKDTDAILQVSAPAGSLATISKGSVSKSDSGRVNADDNNTYDYVFAIPQAQFDSVNPWTVTATLAGQSASSQVVIGSKKSYHSLLSFWVPAEYQAVAYLESSGSQYIDTGISLSEAYLHVISDFDFVSSGNWIAWGHSSGNTVAPSISGANNYVTLTGVNKTMPGLTKGDGWHDIEIEASKPSSIINYTYTVDNGTPESDSGSGTLSTGYTYRLFGKDSSSIGQQRHKRFKMLNSNGNTLIDLRACYRKSDNVAGFWDAVSDTFFTNAGSGTFTVGPNI